MLSSMRDSQIKKLNESITELSLNPFISFTKRGIAEKKINKTENKAQVERRKQVELTLECVFR